MAKSTPCIDRSGVLAGGSSGSVQGPTGNQTHRHATRKASLLSTVPITVTSLADSGTGTLRAAITTADAGSISNQYAIGFASGLTGTINLTEALANLSNNISITGPGASSLIINRVSTAADFSIFTVNSSYKTINISGVTIKDGNAGTNSGDGVSMNCGTLTVTNSIFSDNSASFGGGGIYNGPNSVSLTVTDTICSGNSASGGGGIHYEGSGALTVSNSTFSSNDGSTGGGIQATGGTLLTVTSSTFSGNYA